MMTLGRSTRRFARPRAVFVLMALILCAWGAGALDVPYLSGRIVDEADLIPAVSEVAIEAKLTKLEAETGAQVAILTVPTLDGDPLEDYTLRVVETWKLGQEEKDNGVLFFVARDDRKMRLEVGYGLEGQLTDLATGRILDDIVRPSFKAGDFAGGVAQGVDAIDTAVRNGADAIVLPAVASAPQGPSSIIAGLIPPLAIAVIGIFLPGCIFMAPLAVSSFAIFGFASMFVSPPVAALLAFAWMTFFILLRQFLTKVGFVAKAAQWGTVKGPLGRRTWTSGGGWGGGGGWSSGGGGGGFSGGGGSFGGGGSSSSW